MHHNARDHLNSSNLLNLLCYKLKVKFTAFYFNSKTLAMNLFHSNHLQLIFLVITYVFILTATVAMPQYSGNTVIFRCSIKKPLQSRSILLVADLHKCCWLTSFLITTSSPRNPVPSQKS